MIIKIWRNSGKLGTIRRLILALGILFTMSSTYGADKISAANAAAGYMPWTWNSSARILEDNGNMWFADVNGDGKADLITKGETGAANAGFVYVALSNGTGYPAWTWHSGKRMIDDNSTIWFADVNGDGKADLISKGQAGALNAGYIYVSLSNGKGYSGWTWHSSARILEDNSKLWFDDVNGDGKSDLISKGEAGAWNAGFVYVALSNGTGYPAWTWNSGKRMIDDNSTMWLADVNGDKKADLLTKGQAGAANAGFVYVSLSTGSSYPSWTWDSGRRMIDDNSSMWFADINGDRKSDLVSKGQTGAANSGQVYVSLSNGTGYPWWTWDSGSKMFDNNSGIAFADVDGDGKTDLLGVGEAGAINDGWVYFSLSTGTGFEPWTWNSGRKIVNDTSSLWLADVNGDGKSDIITKGAAPGPTAGFVFVALSTYLDLTKTQYEYNAAGQLKTITYPDGTKIYYEYDNNGNLISRKKITT
ncbi:FG-GAP-like repeat-containing protein [Paenibacillus sp. KS-LC4]|uniref:FG-GAP-like repeat-containing protein n=1 Tax=Paenibacillus sp. KS-LC4 TaxID=2979727 RepID=UPI0030D5079A